MLSRKNIYIIIGVIVLTLAIYGAYSWYSSSSQEQPSSGGAEEGTEQEQPEIGSPENNNPAGEEEPNINQGGLIICFDQCGDGVCLSTTCTDDMNCPCPETPEDCPQDCGN
ncbi:hypothetical protein KKC00_01400 [Patescibacteria group bacterium]|nr:hypothetical protein [Patescibacteria group bacterium]